MATAQVGTSLVVVFSAVRRCLERELEEETGVTVVGEPGLFALYSHFDEFPGDHIALFIVDRWKRSLRPRGPIRRSGNISFFGSMICRRVRLGSDGDYRKLRALAPHSAW
jgi:8-oxo-dGTP pyrophosphatase MutT (NUDIX family)